MHPLGPDVTQYTDTELQNKILELGKKLTTAMRMGNSSLISQIQMLYNESIEERNRRDRVKVEELLKSGGKKFDDIIDVS